MEAVAELARARKTPVHLDGARLFNAATALGLQPSAIARPVDTVAVCLSKGLSAPVGALLAGRRAVIEEAHRLRKMLGGTQRQLGITAAAGLEAVSVMPGRLAQDHARARDLGEAINALDSPLSATIPQTNIVQVDLSRTGRDSTRWVAELEAQGLLVRPLGRHGLRLVTHRHIEPADTVRAAAAFRLCLGPRENPGTLRRG